MQEHICSRVRDAALALQQESEVLALLAAQPRRARCRIFWPAAAPSCSIRSTSRKSGAGCAALTGSFLPASWLAPQPAWSAAFLLIIGFRSWIVRAASLRMRRHRRTDSAVTSNQNSAAVLSAVRPVDPASDSGSRIRQSVRSICTAPTWPASMFFRRETISRPRFNCN